MLYHCNRPVRPCCSRIKWIRSMTSSKQQPRGQTSILKLDRLEGKVAEVDDSWCVALPSTTVCHQINTCNTCDVRRDEEVLNCKTQHWLTCPASRRCSVPERRLPATGLCPSCSWSQSSWRRTFPGPEQSSGTQSWPLPCSGRTDGWWEQVRVKG